MPRFFQTIIASFCIISVTIAANVAVIFSDVSTAYGANKKSGQSLSIIRDTEIETILKEWSEPIFKAAGLNPQSVHFILVNNDAVNAFVAGGANIFLYTGLINKTDNPNELIGVIAHETGHIAGGHLIRSRESMDRTSYESIIGILLGVGAAIISGDASAVSAGVMGGSSYAQRRYLAYSRIQESSADQAALSFLEKAKMNPIGLESFMQKMQSDMYMPQSQQSEYVRTHPLMENRMKAIKYRVQQSPYLHKAIPVLWNKQHARMKAKLLGFIHPERVPWVYDDRDKSIPAIYARAIADYRNDKFNSAITKVDQIIGQEPENPYFLELKAQILLEFGHVKKAVLVYRKASSLLPDAALLHIALAHALIESTTDKNDPIILKEAINELQHALQQEPRSTRIHRLLATAYGRLGQKNRAKLHLAEEAVLQRRYSYAKQHIKAILATEGKGSPTWIKAKDLLMYINNIDNKGSFGKKESKKHK